MKDGFSSDPRRVSLIRVGVVCLVLLVAAGPSQAATFPVNSTGDEVDSNPGNGVCATAGGVCTLRAAIQEANALAGTDTINFNIAGPGPYTIQPNSLLPVITNPVIIDGTTQPGFGGAPIIELDGTNAGGVADGLDVSGGGSTIKGLIINRFSSNGIYIFNNGGNTIVGNYIGTNAAGTAALSNGANGVSVNGPANNVIGGSAPGDRNVVSGNLGNGVSLLGSGSISNVVAGNHIGTDAGGTATIGNALNGVRIIDGSGNVIGGTAAAAGNLIVYNGLKGVNVYRSSGTPAENALLGNSIHGNTEIGIDLGNNGVTANDGVKSAGQPNLYMDHPVFTSALLSGTTLAVAGYVGIGSAGAIFANSRVEVFLSDIDPTGYGEGRTYLGFLAADGSGNFSGSLTVSGLAIGDRITGTATDNTGDTSEFGPNVMVGPYTVSGTVYEDVNYGGGAGRDRAGSPGVVRSGARVELYDNAGNFVDNTTTNGSGNYSFSGLTAAAYAVRVVSASVTSSRTGYVAGLLPVQTFRTNASTGTAVAVTDHVGGHDPSTGDAGNAAAGWILNAATGVFSGSGSGKAHAFAPVTVGAANVTGVDFGWNFDTIVNTNDAGQGSLRQFLANANALGGDASLNQSGRVAAKENGVFMISNGTAGAGLRAANNFFIGGVATISPASALPTIGTQMVIDAQKQPGWTLAPIIELNGAGAGGGVTGLTLGAGGSVVSGLVINRFRDQGILLTGGASTVTGNYVGTDATGTVNLGNINNGIVVQSAGNTVGGATSATRNIFSGNGRNGIQLNGAGASGNYVLGNHVGTDASGTAALPNGDDGIDVNLAPNNFIGGTNPGEGNVISGNADLGLRIAGNTANGNIVRGNRIGTDATGAVGLANGTHGIHVYTNASSNAIGGTTAGAGNIVAFNTADGIAITTNSTGVRISGNSIFSNNGLGIDLGDNGPTANDAGDADSGPNLLQNFPVLSTAVVSSGNTTIAGTFNSAPGTVFSLEFFSSPTADPTGYGEGRTFLGTATANTDGSGNASFTTVLPVAVTVGYAVSSTATDPAGNTSEFSRNVTVMAPAYRPDAMAKLSTEGAGAYATDNVYEATAATQLKSLGVPSASTATFHLLFENDGNVPDNLAITQAAADNCAGFTVQYLDNTSTDRTAAVTGGGYTISGMAPGAGTTWTLSVTPAGTVTGGSPACGVSVAATSAGDGTRVDQVRGTTSSTSANLTLLKSADRASVAPGEDITYTIDASNGAGLTPASAVVVTDPIPAFAGFRVGSATFSPGTSTLSGAAVYSSDNGSTWTYTPVSGGCSAPSGYDFCVTNVRWTMTGTMPAGTGFSVTFVVRVR